MFQTVLEKGISSWIEFGMNIKGMRAARGKDMDIASIVKQSILKARFKKKFKALNPNRVHQEKGKGAGKVKTSGGKVPKRTKPKPKKPIVDRKNYGAWYLAPTCWEPRFKKLTHKAKETDLLLVEREEKEKARLKKARLMSTRSGLATSIDFHSCIYFSSVLSVSHIMPV